MKNAKPFQRFLKKKTVLHSYTRIFVHFIWATKKRQRLLTTQVRPLLSDHLKHYSRENGIAIDTLKVQLEHVHALINLMSNQQVDNIAKLLKGESSHWINGENLMPQKFSWQRGYSAFSVGISDLDVVRNYIRNQDEHHRVKSFSEEFDDILKKNGFQPFNNNWDE